MTALLEPSPLTAADTSILEPAVDLPSRVSTAGRTGRRAITVVIGLILLSTLLLVALAIVALTDSGEADEGRDDTTSVRPG